MADKFNFTKAEIDALPLPPAGQRKFYYDKKVEGLAVRVFASGAKVFYLYRFVKGKPLKQAYGPFPDLTIEQARNWARERNAEIARGVDPSAERAKARAEWTVKDLFEWYLERHAKVHKRSWRKDEQNFNNHLARPLGAVKVGELSVDLMGRTHDAIRKRAGRYAANRVLALVSGMYGKAIAMGMVEASNPARGVKPFQEEERERRVTQAEMPRLMAALDDEPNETLRDYIYMLLYTGARRSNVLAMRWDQIDFASKVWVIPMTKNGKSQVVPLQERELALLKRRQLTAGGCPWVFPGRSDTRSGHLEKPDRGWRRILDRAGLTGLRLHDLRRTLGSWMADSGASLLVIGKTLHHQSQRTTLIYARIAEDPVRDAKARAHEAMGEASPSARQRSSLGSASLPPHALAAIAVHVGGRRAQQTH